MTAWSQDTLTLLAHAVHYALVAGGLIGLGWLLVPHLVTPHAPGSPRPTALGEHELRIAALRSAAATGRLATLEAPAAGPREPSHVRGRALVNFLRVSARFGPEIAINSQENSS